ncbi:MAG: hypothetical protein K8U57_18960 [Planctomycetes bacterium]|nr:hypothetical protein [Planctomycetota bacterium]
MKVRFILVAFFVVFGSFQFATWRKEFMETEEGIEKIKLLIRGKETVQLASFEIYYQQRRVRCSDPEALRYLESCLWKSRRKSLENAGLTYRLRLQFAGGGSVDACTYWSPEGFHLYVPGDTPAGDGGSPSGVVVFKSPMPASIKVMIDFLQSPNDMVMGTVLILEGGGMRRENDPSIEL